MTIAETADAIGSLIRTILGGLFIGAIGYGGGWLYTNFNPDVRIQAKEHQLKQAQVALDTANQQLHQQQAWIHQLDQDLKSSRQKIAKLDMSLRLLKVSERVAEIVVLDQRKDPASGDLLTEFRFQEVNKQGKAADHPRSFRIVGDLVYIDYLVAKFNDALVEQADSERATSICLFHRIFGEFQQPYEGFTLDQNGQRPRVYGRNGAMSEFEQELWGNFWNIANDPARAAQLGIRAAHGEAVATRLRPGKSYRVTLRASGGLSIRPVAAAKPNAVTQSN
jgi:exonuclease VII small subunit